MLKLFLHHDHQKSHRNPLARIIWSDYHITTVHERSRSVFYILRHPTTATM